MDTFTKDKLLKLSRVMGVSVIQLKKDLDISDAIGILTKCKDEYDEATEGSASSESLKKSWSYTALKYISECIDFDEANTLRNINYVPFNTKAWIAITNKVSEFGYILMEDMRSVKEVKELWGALGCPTNQGEKAIEKWNGFTLRDLELAGDDIEKVKEVWRESYHPSKARDEVEIKLGSLVKKLTDSAENYDQAWYTYDSAWFIPKIAKPAFEKVLTFVNNFRMAKITFDKIYSKGSNEKHLALEKCLEFGNIYELVHFYGTSVRESETGEFETRIQIDKLVLEISQKTENLQEIKELFNYSHSEETKVEILKKLEEISMHDASTTETYPELRKLLPLLPENSLSRKIVIQKMSKLALTS